MSDEPKDPSSLLPPSEITAEITAENPAQNTAEDPTNFIQNPGISSEPTATSTGFRAQIGKMRQKFAEAPSLGDISKSFTKASLKEKFQGFEPAAAAEWATRTFSGQNANFYVSLVAIILCAYFLADVVATLGGRFIPEAPVSRVSRGGGGTRRLKSMNDYNVIFTRNLFNSKGIIPGEENINSGPSDMGGPAVRTSLPFNLIGTMVLKDEIKSIATIEDKSASSVYPVRVSDEIPSKAKILKIEARRVTFVNIGSGRREFVELPDEFDANVPQVTLGGRGTGGGAVGIERTSANSFNIDRKEVDKTLADLNNVLTQARAVPNFENGVSAGYKLFQIVPGSIYEKLGLQNGDAITGLNGDAINDPGKAFAMLNEVKTANHMELQVKRDGKVSTFSYDFH